MLVCAVEALMTQPQVRQAVGIIAANEMSAAASRIIEVQKVGQVFERPVEVMEHRTAVIGRASQELEARVELFKESRAVGGRGALLRASEVVEAVRSLNSSPSWCAASCVAVFATFTALVASTTASRLSTGATSSRRRTCSSRLATRTSALHVRKRAVSRLALLHLLGGAAGGHGGSGLLRSQVIALWLGLPPPTLFFGPPGVFCL